MVSDDGSHHALVKERMGAVMPMILDYHRGLELGQALVLNIYFEHRAVGFGTCPLEDLPSEVQPIFRSFPFAAWVILRRAGILVHNMAVLLQSTQQPS